MHVPGPPVQRRHTRRDVQQMNQRRGCGAMPRLLIAVVMVGIALVSYCSNTQVNPVTGETQRVALNVDQEIAMGLQAAPEMAAQHGGVERNTQASALVKSVGQRLVAASEAANSPYEFDFHLLQDPETINAFALPGGQVFVTRALFNRFETEGQLAGVLGHEIAHVIHRHSAEQMAKAGLTQGLSNAAVIAAGDQGGGQMAAMIGQMVNMKYGRDDELESDLSGLQYMYDAGYDPRALIGVMKILEEAGGGGPPEMMSTHPKPANRIAHIENLIQEKWPGGVPGGLKR